MDVRRASHILRVHGHKLVEDRSAERAFDGSGLAALERLFHGLTRDGQGQASFSATQSGIGCETASDVARLGHLGALMASRPRVRA